MNTYTNAISQVLAYAQTAASVLFFAFPAVASLGYMAVWGSNYQNYNRARDEFDVELLSKATSPSAEQH